uniref:Uncharacterized protein n=1 Tax=Arundo donax TaxID=35708 RepID=A0A0A9DS33_ARUDO
MPKLTNICHPLELNQNSETNQEPSFLQAEAGSYTATAAVSVG